MFMRFAIFTRFLHPCLRKLLFRRAFMATVIIFAVFVIYFEYTRSKYYRKNVRINTRPTVFTDVTKIKEFYRHLENEKVQGQNIYQSFLPSLVKDKPARRILPGILIKETLTYELPATCMKRNASIWRICDPPHCQTTTDPIEWDYPRITNVGEDVGIFIDHVLQVAWGKNPPSIDLYVRSGCHGLWELKYLLKSIEIFWPRFLGSVVLVLDAGDESIVDKLIPSNPSHHYIIAFEHLPCISPRVFNQYSYLNLDRHCTAEYVVTIDSDCVFHTPITPDLIFRQGKVILTSSRTFQGDMWISSIDFMMDAGMYDGHYMVSQPITFALSTFASFRQWFYKSKGLCYEDRLSQIPEKHQPNFCWMCQLGTYLERAQTKDDEDRKYWYHHLNDAELGPFLRFSTHVTHEPYNSTPPVVDPTIYRKSVNEVMKQGLCRAFGDVIFHICRNQSHFDYVNLVTFLYAHMEIQVVNTTSRYHALNNYVKRLKKITASVMNVYRSVLKSA